jgi:hypothetical protein
VLVDPARPAAEDLADELAKLQEPRADVSRRAGTQPWSSSPSAGDRGDLSSFEARAGGERGDRASAL